jgi:hypothetical protein
MKKTVLALISVALLAPALALSPIELIKGVNGDLLEDYSRPLVESYGVAMGTGWYHSANTHKLLGFDVGVRAMFINIPTGAKTFTARVKACSVNTTTGDIDTFYVTLDGVATIFGQGGSTPVNVPGRGIAIPPQLPGGLDVTWMPFLVPQASIGLPLGLEITGRYIPWPFEGTTVEFLGIGIKDEITTFIKLPFNLSVQGFYQSLKVGSEVNSTTWGGNLHISKSLLLFAPYAGVGFDKTTTDIKYTFHAEFPTGIGPGGEIETEPVDIPIDAHYDQAMNVRGTLGVALKFGLMLINADYNYNLTTGYHAANLGVGISIR